MNPRTFEDFPPEAACPICGTANSGETRLIQVAGTNKGGLVEGLPTHTQCLDLAHKPDDRVSFVKMPDGGLVLAYQS